MNWSDLPVLLAVVEHGNFSAAARQLKLSQPTVGRRITALEEHFGTALLQSNGQRLQPTEIGQKVLDHARIMDQQAEAIVRSIESEDESLAGPVTISSSQGIGDYWLPLVLQEFRASHPEIRLQLDVSYILANLARREADIALRWFGPGNQNSLIGRKVVSAGFGLYASSAYLQKNGRPQCVEDLAEHAAVMIQVGEATTGIWPSGLENVPVPPREIALRSNSFHTHEKAIQLGFGIGGLAHAQSGWVEGIEPVLPELNQHQDLWIVAHDDLAKNPRIRLAFDYLVQALKDDQEYFATGNNNRWLGKMGHR